MTILRPVMQRAPANLQVLEDTSLPFSFVLTPFGPRSELDPPKAHTPPAVEEEASSSTAPPDQPPPPQPLRPLPIPATLVAKCTHCGSPSNPCSPCLDNYSDRYLCGLCCNSYLADATSQHAARRKADWSSSNDGRDAQRDELWKEAYRQRRRKIKTKDRAGGDGYYDGRRGMGGYDEVDTVGVDPATRRHVYELSLPVVPAVGDDAGIHGDALDYDAADAFAERHGSPEGSYRNPQRLSPFAVPARLCPPILLFLVDATSSVQSYYDAVCQSMYKAMETAPDYARVGIFLATEGGRMSVFDLGGSVPHLKHCRVPTRAGHGKEGGLLTRLGRMSLSGSAAASMATLVPLIDVAELNDVIVPLCSYHRAHVEAAIRALGDMTTVIGGACRHSQSSSSSSSSSSASWNQAGECMHLGASIEGLLDYLADGRAFHPDLLERGAAAAASGAHQGFIEDWALNVNDEDTDGDGANTFRYAGGKIMCFLSGAPMEIDPFSKEMGTETNSPASAGTGTGGFGGSCAEVGRRFAADDDGKFEEEVSTSRNGFNNRDNDEAFDPESGEMMRNGVNTKSENMAGPKRRIVGKSTSRGLKDADLYFNELGIRCANAAIGVELFLLDSADESHPEKSCVGLPIIRLISDRSGGCGPLLVTLNTPNASFAESSTWDNWTGGSVGALLQETQARCPWGRPVAFGALLRLRMTPSMNVDCSPVGQRSKRTEENGQNSQRVAALYKNNGFFGPLSPGATDLALAGTCDETTTCMFDVDIIAKSKKVSEQVFLEGRGEVELNPCIQSCFAYTSVLKHGDTWVTVRRLRVLSTNMKASNDTEDVYASLDTEALAVALFHKLALASIQDGPEEVQHIAQDWLLSTLLCTYRSAESYYERVKVEDEHGIPPSRKFYASERLLGHGGSELTDREILLAQGHDRLNSLPLLVFALLQCDAFRPEGGSFFPSIDSRAAASANMANMPPGSLARCIAPRIELWVEDRDGKCKEPLVESVNMNLEALRLAYADLSDDAQSGTSHVPVLLIDSPRQIVVCCCRDVVFDRFDNKKGFNNVDVTSPALGPILQRAIQESVESYRVRPPVLCCLGDSSSVGSFNEAVLHLQDALLEDSCTNLSKQNFERWGTEVANLLHSEIISGND